MRAEVLQVDLDRAGVEDGAIDLDIFNRRRRLDIQAGPIGRQEQRDHACQQHDRQQNRENCAHPRGFRWGQGLVRVP